MSLKGMSKVVAVVYSMTCYVRAALDLADEGLVVEVNMASLALTYIGPTVRGHP